MKRDKCSDNKQEQKTFNTNKVSVESLPIKKKKGKKEPPKKVNLHFIFLTSLWPSITLKSQKRVTEAIILQSSKDVSQVEAQNKTPTFTLLLWLDALSEWVTHQITTELHCSLPTLPPKQMENSPFLFHIFTSVFLTCCNGLIGGDAGLRDSVSRDTVWNPSTQCRLAKRSSQYTCKSVLHQRENYMFDSFFFFLFIQGLFT